MKSKLCWRNNFLAIGMIVFLIMMMCACSDKTTNYSETGSDTHRTEQTGIINALTGLFGNNEGETPTTREYVYVNNDMYESQNYVSAFSINTDGTLVELAGSPYATNGNGGGTSFAINTIALAPTKRLLFASNVSDSTITAFSINNNDGTLTIIGSPVSSGGSMGGTGSLVVSNDENYLFVANNDTNNISVFTISSTGGLTAVTGSPFNIGGEAYGMTLNLSGDILYIADPDNNTLIALNVAGGGSLSPIAGSPFTYTAYSSLIVSFALSSSTIGIAADIHGVLSSYSIDAIGAPTLLNVLNTGVGSSQCVTTARNGSIAILSGGGRDFISVVNVAANGSLTQVAGSPFATATYTGSYAVANPEGTFLYATEDNQLEGFSIGANGALTSLGTFPITNGPGPSGIVIYAP
jgi:6-phosphogluconolactonase